MTDIPYTFSNTIELSLNIGIAQYADQIREESIKKGFNLNFLFIGRRGLGTKTLINSLFSVELIKNTRGNSIETVSTTLKENNINLHLSITTYHEFDINVLKTFFETKNKQFLEMNLLSNNEDETRIHGCIFLLPSDELSLNEINCLQYLSNECNLIPVMAKSDCYTKEEVNSKRLTYKELFGLNEIHTFAPTIFSHSDESILREKGEIEDKTPLSVIASEQVIKEGDKFLRVREYNWGTIYITKEPLNDFNLLRKILISQNSMDLIYLTETVFYNKFRFFHNKNRKNEKAEDVLKRLKEFRIKIEEQISKNNSKLSLAEMPQHMDIPRNIDTTQNMVIDKKDRIVIDSAVKLVIDSSSIEEGSLDSVITDGGIEEIQE